MEPLMGIPGPHQVPSTLRVFLLGECRSSSLHIVWCSTTGRFSNGGRLEEFAGEIRILQIRHGLLSNACSSTGLHFNDVHGR